MPPRADELFHLFTRLEFTLKDGGYGKADHSRGIVVRWDDFAKDHLGRAFSRRWWLRASPLPC